MKITLHLIIYFVTISCLSQNGYLNKPFVGNWEGKHGKDIFKVHLYHENGLIKGDYKLINTNENGLVSTIYYSDKITDFGFKYGHAINGSSKDGKTLNALVRDNVLLGDGIHTIKNGELFFKLKNKKTAHWKIKNVTVSDTSKNLLIPKEFSVPIDIILTKVSTIF